MNILVDINHSGQVHLFKNIWTLKSKNNHVFVTLKKIPAAEKLLKIYGINYISLGKKKDSLFGKLLGSHFKT
jgi:predicted glycosyltransferase